MYRFVFDVRMTIVCVVCVCVCMYVLTYAPHFLITIDASVVALELFFAAEFP